jgi:hypothetical protein
MSRRNVWHPSSGQKNPRARNQRELQPPAQDGSSLADISTLKIEAIRSYETSVYTRSARRHVPEDSNLHSHRHGNLRILRFATKWNKVFSDDQPCQDEMDFQLPETASFCIISISFLDDGHDDSFRNSVKPFHHYRADCPNSKFFFVYVIMKQ